VFSQETGSIDVIERHITELRSGELANFLIRRIHRIEAKTPTVKLSHSFSPSMRNVPDSDVKRGSNAVAVTRFSVIFKRFSQNYLSYTVTPRLTKIILSGITFVSRNLR
jgi:hypothetical protein